MSTSTNPARRTEQAFAFSDYVAEFARDLRTQTALHPRVLFGALTDTSPAVASLAGVAKTARFTVRSIDPGVGSLGPALAQALELKISPAGATTAESLAAAIVEQGTWSRTITASTPFGLMLVVSRAERLSDSDLGLLFRTLNRIAWAEAPISAIIAGTPPTLRRAARAWPDLEMFGRKFYFEP